MRHRRRVHLELNFEIFFVVNKWIENIQKLSWFDLLDCDVKEDEKIIFRILSKWRLKIETMGD